MEIEIRGAWNLLVAQTSPLNMVLGFLQKLNKSIVFLEISSCFPFLLFLLFLTKHFFFPMKYHHVSPLANLLRVCWGLFACY